MPVIGGQPLPRHIMPWPHRGFVVLVIPQPMLRPSGRRKPRSAEKFRRCSSGFDVRTGNLDDSLRPQRGEVLSATVADGGRNSRQTDLPLVSTLDQLAPGATSPDFGVLMGELAN
jgi:hypothetical protein